MHGFTVRQQDNSQIPPAHLLNRRPTTNAAVLLSDFSHGIPDHMLDPLQLDTRAIGPFPNRLEVPSELHGSIIADATGRSGRRFGTGPRLASPFPQHFQISQVLLSACGALVGNELLPANVKRRKIAIEPGNPACERLVPRDPCE